jgi:hypothetical protein
MTTALRYSRRVALAALLVLAGTLAAGTGVPTGFEAPAQPAKTVAFSLPVVDTAIVTINVRRYTGPTSAIAQTGTGVVLPGGRIVTATHLFKEAWTDVEIVFGGRNGHVEQPVIWTGQPVHVENRDVTVMPGVRIPEWVKPVKVSKRPAMVNDAVVSVGLSRPSRPRIRGGIVDEVQPSGAIVIDVNSSEGDSGGPTFNQNNELVGVHNGVEFRTWEGKWGKRTDVFSVSVRVTDLPQVVKVDTKADPAPDKKP